METKTKTDITLEEKLLKFNIIKHKLAETEKLAHETYSVYTIYKECVNKLRTKLEELCDHEWEIDRTQFDIDRTHYTCNKCEKGR